jgi:hypothetical protein
MVHYYDWAGVAGSPFHYDASDWGLTKPLVVAEFYPACGNCGAAPYETLHQRGYAGALSWSWTDTDPPEMLAHIAALSAAHPQDVELTDPGTPSIVLTRPVRDAAFPSGATVPMEAQAFSPSGEVTRVEFIAGGHRLGEDTSPPYTFSWSNVTAGAYALTARVTDSLARSNLARTVDITVGAVSQTNRLEAEDADFNGSIRRRFSAAASGGAYLDLRDSGTMTWTLPALPAAGSYELEFRYNLNYDTPKEQYLRINGGPATVLSFNDPRTGTWLEKSVPVTLSAGVNQVAIEKFWGWMSVDYLELVYEVFPPVPVVLRSASVAAGQLHVEVDGPSAAVFALLHSTNLADWSVVTSAPSVTLPVVLRTGMESGNEPQFHAVELMP